jgi:tRNA (guanine-N7-)-methyltransferase
VPVAALKPVEPEAEDPRFHGRRHGRRLRASQQRLLDTVLPGIAVGPDDAPRCAAPASLFAAAVDDLWLEIGFGAGEHLAEQAARHPAVGFIGAEPFVNGVARLLAQIEARGLANIRILADDVRPFLADLPPACLGRVYILFPDPWPKARHRQRRIVNRTVLDRLARAMRPGAELRLATDDGGYLRWMLRELLAHPQFEWTARRAADWRERPADGAGTRYEDKNRSGGFGPVYLTFRRRT